MWLHLQNMRGNFSRLAKRFQQKLIYWPVKQPEAACDSHCSNVCENGWIHYISIMLATGHWPLSTTVLTRPILNINDVVLAGFLFFTLVLAKHLLGIQRKLQHSLYRSFLVCWPVHGYALNSDRCTAGCEPHSNFADESVCMMADNACNWGTSLTLRTAWRHYVSCWAMRFMHGTLVMICKLQAAAPIPICSHSVTVSEKCGTPWCSILLSNVYFCDICEIWSARKCRRKFRRKFRVERVPSRQTIHSLVTKLTTTGLFNRRETRT
jgi:hypothetical protein